MLLLVLCAAAGFAVASWPIREAAYRTAYRDSDLLRDRLRRALEEPTFDTLVLGTSRSENQVDPDVFDAAMRAGGHPTRTYVLGIAAGSIPELDSVARALLRARPCCLARVILEPDFGFLIPAQERTSDRAVHFDTLPNVLTLWSYIGTLGPGAPSGRKRDLRRNILLAMGLNLLNVGLVHRIFSAQLGNHAGLTLTHGYRVLGETTYSKFANDPELIRQYHSWVEEMTDVYRGKADLSALVPDVQWQHLVELVRLLQEHGLKVALLHAPQLVSWKFGVSYVQSYPRRCIPGVPLFDLSNPDEYPDFFKLDNRFDLYHVNGRMAPIYTAEIARKLLAYLDRPQDFDCRSRGE